MPLNLNMDLIERIMTTQFEIINHAINIMLSALKKLPSRSVEGYMWGFGRSPHPTYTGPLLAFDLFSVESYLHSGKVTQCLKMYLEVPKTLTHSEN